MIDTYIYFLLCIKFAQNILLYLIFLFHKQSHRFNLLQVLSYLLHSWIVTNKINYAPLAVACRKYAFVCQHIHMRGLREGVGVMGLGTP